MSSIEVNKSASAVIASRFQPGVWSHIEPTQDSPRKASPVASRRTPVRCAACSRLQPVAGSTLLSRWTQHRLGRRHTCSSDSPSWEACRLRILTILRYRQHRRGLACGIDHQRWPNAYFQQIGLFTMSEAYRQLIQPRWEPPTGEPDAGDLL